MNKLIHTFATLICLMSLDSCTVLYRGIKYGYASVEDYKIFPQDTVKKGSQTFTFAELDKSERVLDTMKLGFYSSWRDSIYIISIPESMEKADDPTAALIVKNDTIIFEHYNGGWNQDTQSCIFSVSKTVTSMLCGVALKEGYIKSLDDPVTDYIPELKKQDPLFDSLKIEHLLDMTAGLKFNEDYSWNPFSKMARLYMGNNAMKIVKRLKLSNKPGEHYQYDSMTSQILGIVIERATGMPYAQYLSEKLWQPLGMEKDALMGLDSRKHAVPKSYGGITTNVRDLAKLGRLYINNGVWDGIQIIDSAFVARSLSPRFVGKERAFYSYSWYWGVNGEKIFSDLDSLKAYYEDPNNLPENAKFVGWSTLPINKKLKKGDKVYKAALHQGSYYGYGLFGQVLYINPRKNIIAVFLGSRGFEDYYNTFERVMEMY